MILLNGLGSSAIFPMPLSFWGPFPWWWPNASRGKKISKATIEKLISLDCGEIKICPKLKSQHITVCGRDRQRVYLGCQLFSHIFAEAISYLLPDENKTSEFFNLVNDTFEILNSRCPTHARPIASAFGLQSEAQENVLRKCYAVCDTMRVGNSKSLLWFQKGFLTSIRSILGCFSDLKKTYQIKYLLTSRFNQDCLENFFSQIRALGRTYDHPLPVEFKNRLRLLIMSRNIMDITLNKSSVAIETDSVDYLTSQLFNGLSPKMGAS